MRLTPSRLAGGFTLLEIMITVSIIGILAAIAIPAFRTYQHRSKRSEAYSNLAAIARVEKAYFTEYGSYIEAVPMPGGGLGANKRLWTAGADVVFAPVGWRPEGAVFYDYDVNVNTVGGACPNNDCFTATAYGDADGNLLPAVISYVQPSVAGATAPTGIFGFGTPVDPSSLLPILNAVAINQAADAY